MAREHIVVKARQRAQEFCDRFGLRVPIVQAPMAGSSPPALAIAVAEGGGMGAAGVLRDSPLRIAEWVERFRAATSGALFGGSIAHGAIPAWLCRSSAALARGGWCPPHRLRLGKRRLPRGALRRTLVGRVASFSIGHSSSLSSFRRTCRRNRVQC
jgi:hypothetical protein